MVKIVKFIIRGEDSSEKPSFEPHFLDDKVLSQPAAAMFLVSKELEHLSALTVNMLSLLHDSIAERKQRVSDSFAEAHQGVKSLQQTIAVYITHLFSRGSLTDKQAAQTAGLLLTISHIDHIADRCSEVHSTVQSARQSGRALSGSAVDELQQCLTISSKMFSQSMRAVKENSAEAAKYVAAENHELHQIQKQYYRNHIDRVHDNACDPALTTDYAALLYSMDRMADDCVGIAEEAMEHAALSSSEKTAVAE